jgi:hypothetical protein
MFSGMNQCAFVIQPALITHAQHFGGINWAHFHFIISTVQYSMHWLLAAITPWHILIMDSLTWDIGMRKTEISNIFRYMPKEHLQ